MVNKFELNLRILEDNKLIDSEENIPDDSDLRQLASTIMSFSKATEACSDSVINTVSIPPSVIKILAEHGAKRLLQNIFDPSSNANPLIGIPHIERLQLIIEEKKDDHLNPLSIVAALFLSLGKVISKDPNELDRVIALSNQFSDKMFGGEETCPIDEVKVEQELPALENQEVESEEAKIHFLPYVFNKTTKTRIHHEVAEAMNNHRLKRGLSRELVLSCLSERLRMKGIHMNARRLVSFMHDNIKDKPSPNVPFAAYDTLLEIYNEHPITHIVPSEEKYKDLRLLIEERKITKQDFRAFCKGISKLDTGAIYTIYDWITENKGSVPLEIADSIGQVLTCKPS